MPGETLTIARTNRSDHIGTPPGDAEALVYYLYNGIRADEGRHERLLRGQPLPEDLEREKIP
jgi:hypothetical protein